MHNGRHWLSARGGGVSDARESTFTTPSTCVTTGVHIPQARDKIFAMSVDDPSGLRFESGCGRNAGDSIAIHDHSCVGLDFAVYGIDNFSVGDGKSLRLSAKCQ